MSIKNILALTVLMSFGAYDIIQAEVIHGVDLPRINITRIVGKWFMTASNFEDDQFMCCIKYVEDPSPNRFTIVIVTEPQTKNSRPVNADEFSVNIFDAKLNDDSNIISTRYHGEQGNEIAWFDIDYDSHIAGYWTARSQKIRHSTGVVTIFSRQKTVSDEVLDKIRNSTFYHAVKREWELSRINNTACE